MSAEEAIKVKVVCLQWILTAFYTGHLLNSQTLERYKNKLPVAHIALSSLYLAAAAKCETHRLPTSTNACPLSSKVVPGDSRHWYSWVKYFFRLVVTVTDCWQCTRMGGSVRRPFSPEWLLGFIYSKVGGWLPNLSCVSNFFWKGWHGIATCEDKWDKIRRANPSVPLVSLFAHLKLITFCAFTPTLTRSAVWQTQQNCWRVLETSPLHSNSYKQRANETAKATKINVPRIQSCSNEIAHESFQTCSRSISRAKAAAAALCLRGPLPPTAMKSCRVKIIK